MFRWLAYGLLMPAIHNLRPMKKAEPLAPMAIGRHSDSSPTKTSAIMPVAHPMSVTPSIHLTLCMNAFRVEFPVWVGSFAGCLRHLGVD